MPTREEPVVYLVAGAGAGAVVRYLVLDARSGAALSLVGIGVMTVLAGLLVGLALGCAPGRAKAFALGIGGSTASLSLYAVVGVTGRVAPSLTFLVSVPLLTAAAVTLGVLAAGRWTGIGDAPQQ